MIVWSYEVEEVELGGTVPIESMLALGENVHLFLTCLAMSAVKCENVVKESASDMACERLVAIELPSVRIS